jgi:hypothetical protein
MIPGRANRDVSVVHSVHIGSGAHPVSYPMNTVGFLPGGGRGGLSSKGVKLITHLHLAPG